MTQSCRVLGMLDKNQEASTRLFGLRGEIEWVRKFVDVRGNSVAMRGLPPS